MGFNMLLLSGYMDKHDQNSESHFLDSGEVLHLSEDWEVMAGIIQLHIDHEKAYDLAYQLVLEFGDLPSVIAQPYHSLLRIDGVTPGIANSLLMINRAVTLVAEKRVQSRPALNNWNAIETYCRSVIGFKKQQNVLAIYIDENFSPIRAEQLSKGTVDKVDVYPREVVSRALQLGANGIIVAKNVPSGRLTPTPCEVEMSDRIQKACSILDIDLADMILIGKTGARSILKG